MTIEKAIELLEFHLKNASIHKGQDTALAIQLGIEALEREQILRREIPYDRNGLLPSETEL